ncbi:hypothetical protein TBS_11970 [Thermobispora bispora]|uniref:Glycosyl transferase family 4 n=1 Tax=Thermobispora bispora (strain ATCC 19993 / DSM 43833 / CBS 139.67 / JCM 10125 / KCTC 9307 / NBRC 14880 / R51) TaxID=469371 RepID=D6Y332_THEBD|nr:family 4 glycosyl transferase [Thermobispora bispora]ADG88907.1 glycosyl transferase family 4 [Thermobispora bispora DSM 43833]QSI48651.1 hypothetical protein CYL17_12910 [Thermobispora bispora]
MTVIVAAAAGLLLAAAARRPPRHLGASLSGLALVPAAVAPAAVLGDPDHRAVGVLLAATAVAVLGLIDDLALIPAPARLIVESVAAGGVVLCGVQVTFTGGPADGPITVMWLVAVANAFGLLDRERGVAPAVTAVGAGCLAGVALVRAEPAQAVLLAALAGAALAFLRPGRMGRSGARFAGFAMACGAIVPTAGRSADVIAAGMLLPAAVALVSVAGRAAHRLRRAGLVPGAVTAVHAGAAAVAGAAGLAVAAEVVPAWPVAAAAAAASAVLSGVLRGPLRPRPARVPVPAVVRATARRA